MNEALLSSKNMEWCTPQDFFDRLNAEFHFTLDAAATCRNAKCPEYYTKETDGLNKPWNLARGVRCFAILHTDARSENGSARHTKNPGAGRPLFC